MLCIEFFINFIPLLFPLDASYALKPQLQSCVTFLLERLCIRMASPHTEVDKEILENFQVHQAMATKELDAKVAKGGLILPEKGTIVQRRLQVNTLHYTNILPLLAFVLRDTV